VTVIVPDGVEVVVRGGGLFASQKIESPERPPVTGGPSLMIDARGPGGTLHVRTRPPRPTVKQSIKRAKQSIRRTLKCLSLDPQRASRHAATSDNRRFRCSARRRGPHDRVGDDSLGPY
jgi:hypothetical protein